MTRSPSKRRNRCLPWASTASTTRPPRRSGQRSLPKRGCGVAISSGHAPVEDRPDPVRGVVDRVALGHAVAQRTGGLRAERQLARARAEAELDEQALPRRADDRLAVDALERQPARAVARSRTSASAVERRAHARVVGVDEDRQAAAAALDVEDRLGAGEDDVGAGDPLGLAVLACRASATAAPRRRAGPGRSRRARSAASPRPRRPRAAARPRPGSANCAPPRPSTK